jgi:Tol biopolymer transport system component
MAMKKRNILTLFVMAFVFFGCAAPASPAEPPAAIIGTEFSPTSTPRPIPTAREEDRSRATAPVILSTPTPTLEPSLKKDGPFLAYFRYVADTYQLVLMNANGEGRKVVALPGEIMDSFMYFDNRPNTRLISPDGRWLAFYTGSAGSYTEMPVPGTADLTLNLLDLKTGEQRVVTPILSKEYPDNFAEAAKKSNDPYITAESLYQAFYNGITSSIGWSPDGRHLAFAGQMDGLSSDLYVYDINTKAIHRLSSGDQELQWINWSPDGKWILHGSVFGVGAGMSFDIYAAAADGSSVSYLSTSSMYGGIETWLNPHEYFEQDNQNGPGSFGLRTVDINTGKITKIWAGSFGSFGADLSGKWIVLTALSPDIDPYLYDGSDTSFRPGLYLINLRTMQKTPIPYPPDEVVFDYNISSVQSNQGIFFLDNEDLAYAFYLSDKGEVKPYDLGKSRVSFSPNRKYWAALKEQEIRLFSTDNVELHKIPLSTGYDLSTFAISWRPDDSGFFLLGAKEIYSVDVQKEEGKLVETNLIDNFGPPVWIDR